MLLKNNLRDKLEIFQTMPYQQSSARITVVVISDNQKVYQATNFW